MARNVVSCARFRDLTVGDKFRVANGDGVEYVVLDACDGYTSIATAKSVDTPATRRPPPFDADTLLELLPPLHVSLYVAEFVDCYYSDDGYQKISFHLTKREAYRALVKHKNEYWYSARQYYIGDFYETLDIGEFSRWRIREIKISESPG